MNNILDYDKICEDYCNKEISINDILSTYNITKHELPKIIKMKNIPNRKILGIKHGKYVDENYFENIDTPDKSYWLGFIAADGHICKSPRMLQIGLALRDLDHLLKFKNQLQSENQISIKHRTVDTKTYSTCTISIVRDKICEDLNKFGLNNDKSESMTLPKLDEALMCHYFRGIIDGDGSFHNVKGSKQIQFKFVSPVESFIYEFRDYLQ